MAIAADLQEEVLPIEDRMTEAGNIREVLTRIELDVASSSEKVLNLDILLMHVSSRVSDCEALAVENEAMPIFSMEKAFEFDILCGVLDSEVKELDCFMTSLQKEIVDARQKISTSENLQMHLEEIEEKLNNAEQSLKQSLDQVSEIRMQSSKFERTLAFGRHDNCNDAGPDFPLNKFPSLDTKWTQSVDQQRHTLQMLEKSLARELDLEKKLSDSKQNEEAIKLKLHYAEHETFFLEEAMETILKRYFEAENAAEVFMGMAKELTGQLQLIQFTLNGSMCRESELRHKLDQNMLKLSDEEIAIQKLKFNNENLETLVKQANYLKSRLEAAENNYFAANLEAITLRNQVNALEKKLQESNFQLQQAKASVEASQEQQNMLNAELLDMENIILDLKEKMLKAESKAESAEARCSLLAETNLELNQELGLLKTNETQKGYSLEEKLKESDSQLEHAKASIEAGEEHQGVLYSALSDMENLIEDLKMKLSIAEKRAESAESRCTLLSEINLELNEELGALRDKLEYLETSLHQADNMKLATAKDIGIKTKVIADLVMKLALERERLQIQISALKEENGVLAKKCLKTSDNVVISADGSRNDCVLLRLSEEAATETSATNIKEESSAAKCPAPGNEATFTVPAEDDSDVESKLASVRTIETGLLNSRHVVVAILVLLIAMLGMYMYQLE